jgi:starvation-inducible DNA-binding protein
MKRKAAKMSDHINSTKKVLGNTYVMYMKAQSYHWNYIGPDFPQYHEFFGNLYAELSAAIDIIAEQLRMQDSFAPGTLSRMIELADIEEDGGVPAPNKMISNLEDANDKLIASLYEAYEQAEANKQFGLSNFLQDRISAHEKHRWMLKSIQISNSRK